MTDHPAATERVFLALLPDAEGLRFLVSHQEHLKRCGWERYGRFLPASSLHLTVRFLGSAAPDTVSALLAGAAEIAAATPDFVYELGRAVLFPRVSRAKILAAKVTPHPTLRDLARAANRLARDLGFPEEEHSFRPHVTLARLKPALSRPNVPSLGGQCPSAAGRLVVYASDLSPEGAAYRELGVFPFAS
jgi:2'-5' RNA ligase